MPADKKNNTVDLGRKVQRRLRIVIKIIKFVELFVMKNGKETKYYQGSSHTHIL